MSEWTYNGEQILEEDLKNAYGFVYEIKNRLTGKRYLGKKLLFFKKSKTVKGKKKRYLAESDWKTYWGSNKALLEDVKKQGEENFERTVLRWCRNKGEANYWEAKFQFERDVLLDPTYYNDYIRVRVHGSHVRNEKEAQR